jgi:hypothetical protein
MSDTFPTQNGLKQDALSSFLFLILGRILRFHRPRKSGWTDTQRDTPASGLYAHYHVNLFCEDTNKICIQEEVRN